MANFSDGTYHPPNTHYAEFKPTRGGRLIHGADYGDNNQYDTYSRNYTEQPRVYNSDRFDYDYSRNQNYSSDVYTQGYDEWGSYYEGRERESRGTRGRPRGGRGKRGRGGHKVGRQFEETRQDPERDVSYPEWRAPVTASPKRDGKKKWRNWDNRQFSNWRESHRGSYNNRGNFVGGSRRGEDIDWNSERIKGATEQTEELIQQIVELSYECVVCCEIVEHQQSVWSCRECFQLFHLACIAKWATAPNSLADYDNPENGWNCPTCRHTHLEVPDKYTCFCGAIQNPVWKKGELPHSCTEICGKSLNTDPEHSQCQHRCKQLCHPGPCPACAAMVQVSCPCKKSVSEMRCNMAVNVPPCTSVCEKQLTCGRHTCTDNCHHGECESCKFEVTQSCYCNKSKRTVLCCELQRGLSVIEGGAVQFSCQQPCSRQISCGNHLCERECHEGECGGCNLSPEVITTCPCGAFQLEQLVAKDEQRESCLDPIPTCHSTCNKVLLCSNPGDPKCHKCDAKCHTGECSVCEKQQLVQCSCGKSRVLYHCKNLKNAKPLQPAKCEKLCNKKMLCGRHRCQDKCCTRANHPCNVICNKRLQCGHKCMELCHTHRCPPCPNTSFDELHCYCGREIMYPPIPCGTLPPKCEEICTRRHPCGHAPRHHCHSEKTCPPCAELVDKLCMCRKEAVCNLPCHQKDPSCGRPCGKPLKCGTHSCTKICHRNLCQSEKDTCVQKCNHARKLCGHACGSQCHGRTACPQTLCAVWVTTKCGCGRKASQLLCPLGSDNPDIQKRIKEKGLSGTVSSILSGKKVDIGKFMELKNIASLDCDEECQKEEWKRRLADAFGVDTSSPIDQAIREMYNPFLKDQARLEPEFVSQLEDQIKRLIHSVQASQSKSQQHVCRVMRPHQRQIVHELASYYNCQTWSLDPEPQRQVVILATRSSIIPSTSLTDLTKKLKKPL